MPPDSVNTEQTTQALLAAADGADAVIFADFGYGTITPGLLQRVMEPLRKTVPIITADVSGRQSNLMLFKSVDLLCPTEREAREAMGDFSSGLGALVWDLLQKVDARHAIITMGRQGLVAFDRPAGEVNGRLTSQYLPALAGRVIDPLGCGDALLAAASLTLAAGGSLAAAAYLGSAAAAIEVQQLGNRPVAAEELSLWARPAHADIERAAVLERLAS
jgi:bifunctional ADP-heptose synthase (sugar kinase/adenylyltransferase)